MSLTIIHLSSQLVVSSVTLYRMGKNLIHVMKGLARMNKESLYISDLFKETVERHPNKIAIIFEDRRITFRELDEMSNRIANLLRAAGLRRGDTAAMFMENCLEYPAILLGLSKLGVTGKDSVTV